MIPDNSLSSVSRPAELEFPANLTVSPMRDHEMGGIALSDPSEGHRVKAWFCEVDGDNIVVGADDVPAVPIVENVPNVREVSLAFDQNMRPTIAWSDDTSSYFRWYDSVAQDYTVTEYSDEINLRTTLDDKRASQVDNTSDIVLTYTRNNNLYFRLQRDRYQEEYLLKEDLPDGRLLNVYMNVEGRLQWVYGQDADPFSTEWPDYPEYVYALPPELTFLQSDEFFKGGEYVVSSLDDLEGDLGIIKILDNSPENFLYQIIKETNTGDVTTGQPMAMFLDREDRTTFAVIEGFTLEEYEFVQEYIDKYFENNSNWATDSFKPPGKGPITALFELDDIVYAARDLEDGSGGQLYSSTNTTDLAKDPEWEPVDMGNVLDYKNGRNAPLTAYDREFLEDELEPVDDALEILPSSHESIVTIRSTEGAGIGDNKGNWREVDKIYSKGTDDDAATARRAPAANVLGRHYSEILRLTGFTSQIADDVPFHAAVKGIAARVRFSFRARVSTTQPPVGRFTIARLANVGGTENKAPTTTGYTHDDISGQLVWGTDFVDVALGGPEDTWEAGNLSTNNVLSPDFGIELEFATDMSQVGSTSGGVTREFFVSSVELDLYFDDGTSRIFFWDGTTDVANADLIDYTVESGSWENNNAAGRLTLYDIVSPEAIVEGLEIRNAENGAGTYIADTDGQVATGTLPTYSELQEHNSRVLTIKENFFMDKDKEAVYGVSGAGPGFVWDGRFLRQVRGPVPIDKDKPRHIAKHGDHLVLGYDSGSVIISVTGEPLLFEGVEGASEWSFGSKITGLIPLKGNALGVFTEKSTHALIGTSIDDFTKQDISRSAGCIEYSLINMGQPIYCDNYGISSISTTEQYGDFNWNKISRSISPWIQDRVQESSGYLYNFPKILAAIPVRHKNQYRLYFSDGTNMTMTIAASEAGDMPMFTFHNYSVGNEFSDTEFVPSAILSTVLSDGRELLMFGTHSGDVYVMEQGTGVLTESELYNYDCSITFNPFNGQVPVQNIKYNQAFVHMKHSGEQELTFAAGVNYLQPIPSGFTDTKLAQIDGGRLHLGRVPDKLVGHLPSVTDGFSLQINSIADGNLPHIVQGITFKVAPSSGKNAAPDRY